MTIPWKNLVALRYVLRSIPGEYVDKVSWGYRRINDYALQTIICSFWINTIANNVSNLANENKGCARDAVIPH